MVNTYHVYVRIVHTKSPHVHLHLSCHPRQFSSFICNWCTFRGEKDNDKRHSIPPYDVIVDKTTLVHIIVHTTIYLLTRIILQRHKSFLLPSNFSPRVVQRLRHPPIMILLLQRIIRMLLYPMIVPAAASPTPVANDTQAAAPAAMVGNANGGKHVIVTRLLSGMPMRRDRRVIWMMSWTMCIKTAIDWKTVSSQRISLIKPWWTDHVGWSWIRQSQSGWNRSTRTMWYHWGRRRWTREEYCNEQLICLLGEVLVLFVCFLLREGSLLGWGFDSD